MVDKEGTNIENRRGIEDRIEGWRGNWGGILVMGGDRKVAERRVKLKQTNVQTNKRLLGFGSH